ncbi:MAG: peptidoglycan DD-metalloendopeptidase family protein [Bacteroidales bacterium]|nr:peptidoglycan DD-metalloendopeptidase family protein [Bacteroidales bacterium]
MKKAALTYGLLMVISCTLSGQTKEDLQQQKQKAFDEIKLARELMEQTAIKRSSSVQRIRILQRGINSRAQLIKTLEQEVVLIDQDIVNTQEQIRKLRAENERNREEYARLVYYAYRNHTNYEKLMYILAGETISQSYQRYKYLRYIGEYRIKMAGEIEDLVGKLSLKEEELNGFKNEKLSLLEAKEREQKKLVGERSRRSSMVADLQRQESRLKREIEEKERIARELEARIREIIEEEARRLNSRNIYAALTPEQELVGNDFRRNKGLLPWPVERGIITTGFGSHEVPGLRGSSIKNNGIDINSAPGTQVRAVFQGEITKVFAILGANYTVLIRHGEFLSVYQNLVNVRVKTGDEVFTKEVLGDAFIDEGNSVSMVHFEVWQERSIMNPEEWLSK